ncbi:DUF6491 family protein [Pseudoxanthomonas dokdonensis]|uniref:Lipoprotein n=1 Tax=Pseudoxanthomonas dokdonensis TaxID=344882 RepID=A0A0R0CI49_9GAMM|nr:DUF6491 family protein [Pseudoxanthomonas dokdonensis]KRG69099.1 hypothetical protein ABB29_11800 [Pseudoxanthomonas dokdonensis]
MKHLFVAACALLVVAGCATGPRQTDAQRLAMYRDVAGAPVKDFNFFGNLTGWTPLGDGALAVSPKLNETYLLTLSGPCPDLDYAQAIVLSSMNGQVSAGFDKVTPIGAGTSGPHIPCRIDTIQPVDGKALKASQQELREASTVQRSSEDAE